jgi:hypothetical protein
MPILIQSGRFSAAAFSPLDLSPWHWSDPSDAASVTLGGSNVSQLNDKSTNGRHLTQGTAGARPTYTSAGINGLNCLTWDGGDTLTASGSLSQPCTVALIVQLASTSSQQVIFGASAFYTQSAAWSWFSGSLGAGPAQDTSLHMIVAVLNSTSSTVRLDGASTATSVGAAAFASGSWEFSRAASPILSGGKTGELIIVPSVVSGTNLTNLESYLRTKWGTP